MTRVAACVSVLALAFVATGLGGADAASPPVPSQAVLCIRHDGSTYRPRCTGPVNDHQTCECGSDFHVTEPLCNAGEEPAPTTAIANRARYAAATKGSLQDARYNGRRFCVRTVNPPADGDAMNVLGWPPPQ
jgi:hypothetical protein